VPLRPAGNPGCGSEAVQRASEVNSLSTPEIMEVFDSPSLWTLTSSCKPQCLQELLLLDVVSAQNGHLRTSVSSVRPPVLAQSVSSNRPLSLAGTDSVYWSLSGASRLPHSLQNTSSGLFCCLHARQIILLPAFLCQSQVTGDAIDVVPQDRELKTLTAIPNLRTRRGFQAGRHRLDLYDCLYS
jgi:hypothetical protein